MTRELGLSAAAMGTTRVCAPRNACGRFSVAWHIRDHLTASQRGWECASTGGGGILIAQLHAFARSLHSPRESFLVSPNTFSLHGCNNLALFAGARTRRQGAPASVAATPYPPLEPHAASQPRRSMPSDAPCAPTCYPAAGKGGVRLVVDSGCACACVCVCVRACVCGSTKRVR